MINDPMVPYYFSYFDGGELSNCTSITVFCCCCDLKCEPLLLQVSHLVSAMDQRRGSRAVPRHKRTELTVLASAVLWGTRCEEGVMYVMAGQLEENDVGTIQSLARQRGVAGGLLAALTDVLRERAGSSGYCARETDNPVEEFARVIGCVVTRDCTSEVSAHMIQTVATVAKYCRARHNRGKSCKKQCQRSLVVLLREMVEQIARNEFPRGARTFQRDNTSQPNGIHGQVDRTPSLVYERNAVRKPSLDVALVCVYKSKVAVHVRDRIFAQLQLKDGVWKPEKLVAIPMDVNKSTVIYETVEPNVKYCSADGSMLSINELNHLKNSHAHDDSCDNMQTRKYFERGLSRCAEDAEAIVDRHMKQLLAANAFGRLGRDAAIMFGKETGDNSHLFKRFEEERDQ